jgi:ornithine--oxo-acid transaminase
VQGESGVLVPPPDYLPALRALCSEREVLLILDEIQSGLGRAGATLAADLVGVRADLVTLGKALGGGIVPVSAVVGRRSVLDVLRPGTHGSTFGGNPLACAVALGVIGLLEPGDVQARARDLGEIVAARLAGLVERGLLARARHVGLWAGVDVEPNLGLSGRELCERLAERGVLAKDTHGSTVRLAPPIVIAEDDLHLGLDRIEDVLREAAPPGH